MRALSDRHKDVRVAAVELLVTIASSEPATELRAFAARILSVKKSLLSTTLLVDPPTPESLPKWLPRLVGQRGLGPNAAALLDVVRYIPPKTWTHLTGLSAEDLLKLGAKTDYAVALYEGWQEAAIRFGDQTWIDAVFKRTPPPDVKWKAELVANVTESLFEAVMIERVQKKGDLSPLLFPERTFSSQLSKAIVESARAGVAEPYLYKNLALNLHPSVLPLVQNPWSEDERVDGLREFWRRRLDLRSRLLKSLET